MTEIRLYELAQKLGQELSDAGLVVTTAESCTGGWIAKCLTDVPGSSDWFQQGIVTYSNAAKSALLNVPESLLDSAGAVSEAVVCSMAEGALRNSAADLAVAVSGVAGPDGGTDDKPVGTVWLAWAVKTTEETVCVARHELFRGNRLAVRQQAVAAALQGLIELLSDTDREA